MLFQKPLYDTIFNILSTSQKYTVQQLYSEVKKQEDISLSSFYRIIDDLLENQTLAKENGKIKLNASWILSLFSFTDTVKHSYFQQNITAFSLQEGEQKTYYASSFLDLDNIWADFLNILTLNAENQEVAYLYNSHLYHMLGSPETEIMTFKNMKKHFKKVCFLIGNQSFLDNYSADILRLQGIDVVCDATTKFMKDGYCVNVIGDMMIEVMIPDIISQYFKVFFDSVKSIQEFQPEMFQNIFKMKAEYKILIRKSKQQAGNLRKEIRRYFRP